MAIGADAKKCRVTKRNLAMVIDDSISVRRVTESLLTSAGWDVITAKDGVDALEKLAALDTIPDVFLCDMEMPRMDGLELVRQRIFDGRALSSKEPLRSSVSAQKFPR